MKESMHLGGTRTRRWIAVEKKAYIAEPPIEEEVVEEEIFHPEAAKTDGNPFPEEPPIEEEVVEETVEEVLEDILDYNSMTVEELRALCRAQGLAVGGKKAELVARLLDADAPSQEAVEVKPGSYVNNPVSLYKLLISKTSGPKVPLLTGTLILLSSIFSSAYLFDLSSKVLIP